MKYMKKCKSGKHEYEASKKQCPECNAANKKEWKLENKDRVHAQEKAWNLANNENRRTNQAHRLATDPLFKLTHNIRALINKSLKNKGYTKTSQTHNILGCDFEYFQAHLIVSAINNYGFWLECEDYHLDHIIPVSSATTEQRLLELNHHSNLQYLYPHHNLAKSDNINWTIPKEAI